MRVKKLKISSFRGIVNLTLDFSPEEPTVFIGNNGVGKSSILDCLAVMLSWLAKRIKFDPEASNAYFRLLDRSMLSERELAEGRYFINQDIKNGHQETSTEITILVDSIREVNWSLNKDKKDIIQFSDKTFEELDHFAKSIRVQWKNNPEISIPLTVYYPVNRAVLNIPLEMLPEEDLFELNAYDQGLNGVQISFDSFFRWFRKLEDLENEERRDNHDYRNSQLESVRQAIYSLIPEFSNLRVRRSPLRMTVRKQGQEFTVNQLSDGEKCLLAMVGDLARRLAIANPGLSNPLEGEGVVLIDEIELHLHPKWQREIIPALTRTFPNCQFIVTTHSPQVVSHVKPEGIFILEATSEGIIAKKPESSFGRDSNQILEDIMGVPDRPQQIKDSLRQLFQLIDAGNLDAAKELRHQISEEIGSDEPEFVRADVLMRRKEIFNR
ncbi:AAA family ATPase [Floridanema aerugineum]|uniref:AAA family ATPase n=1 Tax=Floridaenema aerugineum BLCC-F46 TaxID=3153654 RepID=A0ABV4XCB6_9CYAN